MTRNHVMRIVGLALGVLVAGSAAAQTGGGSGLPGVISHPLSSGGTEWNVSIQTLVLFTALAFLPAVLLLMTGFTRIIIVLSLLRRRWARPPRRRTRSCSGWACF